MSDDLRDLPVPEPALPAPVPHPPLAPAGKTPPAGDERCTPQEMRFIAEYLVDQDGPRAVAAAGYGSKTAASRAALVAKLLARPRIARQIQQRLDRLLIAADITAEKVLREFARVGYADVTDIFEPSGETGRFRFKPLDQWPERVRAAVASIKVAKMQDETGEWVETVEVKFHPKIQALEALAKRIEVLVKKFGGGGDDRGGPGGVHVEHAQILMYFPDNGRAPTGRNPTNAPLAVTYRSEAPSVEGIDE